MSEADALPAADADPDMTRRDGDPATSGSADSTRHAAAAALQRRQAGEGLGVEVVQAIRRRRVRLLYLRLGMAMAILVYFQVFRFHTPWLGGALIPLALVYLYRIDRGNAVVLWLRPFHQPRGRGTRFGRLLMLACRGLGVPITVQDSSFQRDRNMAMWKVAALPPFLMYVISYAAVGIDQAIGRRWLSGNPVALIAVASAASLLITVWLYRRVPAMPADSAAALARARALTEKIEQRRGWLGIGVLVIRCADSAWRDAVGGVSTPPRSLSSTSRT